MWWLWHATAAEQLELELVVHPLLIKQLELQLMQVEDEIQMPCQHNNVTVRKRLLHIFKPNNSRTVVWCNQTLGQVVSLLGQVVSLLGQVVSLIGQVVSLLGQVVYW